MVAALTTAAAHDAGAAARPDVPGLRETVLQHREVLSAHAQVPSRLLASVCRYVYMAGMRLRHLH